MSKLTVLKKNHTIIDVFQHEIDQGAQELGVVIIKKGVGVALNEEPKTVVVSVREWAGKFSRSGNDRWELLPWAPTRRIRINGSDVLRITPSEFEESQKPQNEWAHPLANRGMDPIAVEIAQKAIWFWKKP